MSVRQVNYNTKKVEYVILCYVMLCYVMLCYVMLCYVVLCCVVLSVLWCFIFFFINALGTSAERHTHTHTER